MNASAETNSFGAFRGPYRVEMKCTVEFDGPLHIGTGQSLAVTTDSPILRDHEDKPYLPGSSIRGVLRDFCEREAIVLGVERKCVVQLFGPETNEAKDKKRDTQGKEYKPNDRRGRLTVTDAAISGASSEIRDHVKINPEWGAAATGAKFDNEAALSPDATFTLVYEGEGKDDPELKLIAAVKKAFEDRLLFFGAKSGWGYGAARATSIQTVSIDRSDEGQLKNYLNGRLTVTGSTAATANAGLPTPNYQTGRSPDPVEQRIGLTPWSWMSFDMELQFDGPMLVAGPYREEKKTNDQGEVERNYSDGRAAADAVYIASPNGVPYLPGSSLRGALHAHADRIARTLNKGEIAETLFGNIKKTNGREEGRRGLLHIGEGALNGGTHEIFMDHVAIDRLTGFSAESKLFNSCALASPKFKHRLFVRWSSACKKQEAAVALLLFTLRDMSEGLLWVGSRTTRGYGHLKKMKVSNLTISNIKISDGIYTREAETILQGEPTGWATNAVVFDLVEAWNGEFKGASNG